MPCDKIEVLKEWFLEEIIPSIESWINENYQMKTIASGESLKEHLIKKINRKK